MNERHKHVNAKWEKRSKTSYVQSLLSTVAYVVPKLVLDILGAF